ncbi:Type 1 glutamine amidotransferase-like domain-containing protein [Leifsonia sp. L25]|uniref:Type 1 glutamine amidotransferase-like domain-containing protein n=1 Tax=Leifsonia sp. L25 TaxID=3423957 RepID=UPI003D680445
MKLLLTSGGVTNASIREALIGMLGKPIAESDALFIPTAQWGQPACDPRSVWLSTAGRRDDPGLVGLGWRSVGVLELTALPTVAEERWMPWVRDADVLLVDGGEARYLFTWMLHSGLAAMLPELAGTVWVGVSAGSMVMTPRVGREFLDWHAGRPRRARSDWSTSRSSRTSTTPAGRATRWRPPGAGRSASRAGRTRSMSRRRSR